MDGLTPRTTRDKPLIDARCAKSAIIFNVFSCEHVGNGGFGLKIKGLRTAQRRPGSKILAPGKNTVALWPDLWSTGCRRHR